MPKRQLLVFRIGCIVSVLAAIAHMAGQLAGPQPPANDTERELVRLATTYQFDLPGGSRRALMDFMNGFSLMFAVYTALIGGLGYIVQKRAKGDAVLMLAVARTLAGGCAVLLAISLTHFFIVPTVFIGLMTFCFALASVRGPQAEA